GRNGRTQLGKETPLDFDNLLLGVENLGFILFQLRSREALGIYQRLLPLVVGGRVVQVGLRNLNVVAEDGVELYLERPNPRSLAFARFYLCQILLRVPAQVAEFVQIFVDAGSDHSPIAQRERRLWNQRAIDLSPQIAQSVDQSKQRAQSRRIQSSQHRSHLGNSSERCGQRQHVPRIRRLQRDPAQQAFEVENSVERPPQFLAAHSVFDLHLNRIQPALNLGPIQRRAQHPCPQQSLAHWCRGGIEASEQGHPGIGTCEERFDQFQVAYRHRIEHQAILPLVEADAIHMVEGAALC